MSFVNGKAYHPPERSRFYNLEPLGIGTIEAESFTGYISRLAQEHLVSPVVLIKNSVNKISKLPQVFRENSIPQSTAANLNGFGETAENLVKNFQSSTFRNDIELTTLSAWKNRISTHGLLRKNANWCPKCFQEQLETTGIVYEKLIWTLENSKICLIHQIDLCEVCPHCRSKLKVLSVKSRPGFCSKCLRWLGLKTTAKQNETDGKEVWITEKVSKFLTAKLPIENQFHTNLQSLIRQKTDGNINDFAHLTGVWHLAIRRLLKGEILPTMQMLIDICYLLNFSPVDLFVETAKFEKTKIKQNISNKTAKEEVEPELLPYFDEFPPPSLNEVCRRIGWTTTRFQRHFPNEYWRFVKRYLHHQSNKMPNYTNEEVEKILIGAVSEIPPPSLQSIFRKLGCRNTGYRYYKKFPELCEQIAERFKEANKKVFDVKKAEKILKSA